MNLLFLGTGASEGIPNPYCKCELCENVRTQGGHDVRTRSSALINDEIQIDIAPDFFYQAKLHQIDVTRIKDLLITHTHPDHFNTGELHNRVENFAFNVEHPLFIYGSDKAITGCRNAIEDVTPERFNLSILIPFITVKTSSGVSITPLIANHARWELCYIYLIEKDEKTILYGHDSGFYSDLTWNWLKGKKLDLIVLECTYGYHQNQFTNNHMSIETVINMKKVFSENGNLALHTQIYISHISHSCGFNHQELSHIFAEHDIHVAYDGLNLSI
ncbi:carbon-phosphorus lyase [Testudinibacter sp. TR-2022]|uniref:MBL fold metallo-hydrolase n=1 Tax=Testudinibacter sp. TR-2022 TaxID=2585029 RepID=UPI001117FD83|nr:MBL fold metallo-hydrolase [Testudinibacter sp. TR-2022]TNH05618.1 carbon-phosphorus lyase [Pasteurellaceae bacterium Phil31]TNH04087.1 carbon-phosphorus lyase [Testudinibacter sp. TR-2022]TNH10582.1 carbon-phosphorus lyase [Testudinibacter sp. TR-2022]TNH14053.1 carbon-phosphorus lyase [Testudinibacter sp. TR-2022]TNH19285.1 carbon-phosphorus lyase [Testudinibacter sp. TR-2022]